MKRVVCVDFVVIIALATRFVPTQFNRERLRFDRKSLPICQAWHASRAPSRQAEAYHVDPVVPCVRLVVNA
jgi:hypothetical protein